MRQSVVLATVGVLALAGCGNGSTEEASADQVAASDQAAAAKDLLQEQLAAEQLAAEQLAAAEHAEMASERLAAEQAARAKEELTDQLKSSIELSYNSQTPKSNRWPPYGLNMVVENLILVQVSDYEYKGSFDGKVAGVYGLDRRVQIDVSVDMNDGSFIWETTR